MTINDITEPAIGAQAAPVAVSSSLWSLSDVPAIPSANDANAVEVGLKFRADTSGSIAGIRFYKGAGNGGTHTCSLWTSTGTRLASARGASDSSTGWQTVLFATPVAIQASTTYVASYFAPQGHYSVTYDYFTVSRDIAPLHAPSSVASDPNGVFRYGETSGFPTSTYLSSNYWVDVVFTPGPAPAQPVPLDRGFGGPVLVVKSAGRPFTEYYSEILRAEGFNSFATADLSTISAATLSQYDLVILGETPLTTAQVGMLQNWVTTGGNLIAMRPDKKLAALLGLSDQGATLANGYLLVNTDVPPGAGLPDQTMQYHGTADRYTALSGTATIATLYSDATTATGSPAVTVRNVGTSGGQAVAFTYDLARSVVLTHQGNPAWAGMERDGETPIRPDDLFYGAKVGDNQRDWVNLDKVAIPQADEQQRLLGNLLTFLNQDRKPIPRMWYLPKGHKAAVVMALDDHGTATGTREYFDRLIASSPAGGSVAGWECARGTSWLYVAGTALTDAQAADYVRQGFDLGVHVNTGCTDWTPISLEAAFHAELQAFADRFPSVPAQSGNRTHCIVWSDWASQPKVELSKGIRVDLNYYYWPPSWVRNRPGMFTGSGLPMRFADVDGRMIDVYQVGTHLVNENGQTYPDGIDILLDRAVGPDGYFGVFGVHYDLTDDFDVQVIQSAQARGVPLVSAKQILDWTDGRNSSFFAQIAWSGNDLTFTATADGRTNGMLRGMLPVHSLRGALTAITRGGVAVGFTRQTIKGVTYAMFPVTNGSYRVTYTPYLYPASLWTPATVPANITATDAVACELGVKFTPAVSGRVSAVKFYKGPQNSGPHTVSVWSSRGTRLATATSGSETASGWQTVRLSTPVNVAAGTTYVASYFAPAGHYSYNHDYFRNACTTGPLTAPSSVGAKGNGVFSYGGNVFPNESARDSNYWVDVVFDAT